MKIYNYILVASCALITACGGSGTTSESNVQSTPTEKETARINFNDGKELIGKSDCIGCHKENLKLVGPAYTQIAKKYPATDENIKLLGGKIIKGGSGVWGEIPMTAHPQIKQTDAETMVKYILSLK